VAAARQPFGGGTGIRGLEVAAKDATEEERSATTHATKVDLNSKFFMVTRAPWVDFVLEEYPIGGNSATTKVIPLANLWEPSMKTIP
jgi:hypothetical protein